MTLLKNNLDELLGFLEEAPTAFHAVAAVSERLEASCFTRLDESKFWNLHANGKYYVTRNDSSLIAFQIPKTDFNSFMIGASHSDSPALKIKPNPEIIENGYVKLNIEGYGGMIMSSWLDRPLSVAGRVVIRDGNVIKSRLINVDRDILIIPNLAIHMNRGANKEQNFNAQKDMLPILGSAENAKGYFANCVAKAAGASKEDILAQDLFLYIREQCKVWGLNREYISAPHLDDLECTYGNLKSFLEAKPKKSVPVLAIFDNEEVGSATKQGADSGFMMDTLKRISSACGKNESEFLQIMASSFMVSADNAHAVHPNHPEKSDPVNRPELNKGIVIKHNASQHYTTDAVSAAIFSELCSKLNIPVQDFSNRADERGGSTLGSIANTHVSINTVDVGLAQLAMHSSYETAGALDFDSFISVMKLFFSSTIEKNCDSEFSIE